MPPFGLGFSLRTQNNSTPPFSPIDIAGLVAWYDSEHLFLITGNVDELLDQSGHGNNAVVFSTPRAPTINTADPEYNGRDSLSWSNAASTAVSTPSLTYGTFTIILVAKIIGPNNSYVWADSSADYLYNGVGDSLFTPQRDGSGASGWNHPAGGGWSISGLPRIITRRFDGTHAGDILKINTVLQNLASVASGDPGTATMLSEWLPLSYSDGTASSDATFAAAFIYNNAISDLDLGKLEQYLITKYGLFNPSYLSGIQIWSRADFGVTSSSNLVSAWADQSANGYNFAQTISDSNKPLSIISGIGGHPDIYYSGNQYLYNTTTDLATSAITAFMIIQTSNIVTQDQVWGKGYLGTEWVFIGQGSKIRFALTGGHIDSDNDLNDGLPHYIVAIWDKTIDGGLLKLYVDGVQQVGTGDIKTDDISGIDSIGTGAEIFNPPSTYFPGYKGYLPEVGLYNRSLATDELSKLHTYLATRVGSPASNGPVEIPNCTSWFRVDRGMTLSGSDVVTWDNQSGSGIVQQFTPLNASPQYEASGINGLPDLTFDGITQSLKGTSTLLGTTGITLFGIFSTSTSGVQFVWGMQYNDYHYSIIINSNGFSPGSIFFFNGNSQSVQSPLSYANGLPHAFIGTYDSVSGDMFLYVDDGVTPVATGTGSGVIQNIVGDLNAVGSSTGASANDRLFVGSIAEVGSYSEAISPTNVATLMSYLKSRAGI